MSCPELQSKTFYLCSKASEESAYNGGDSDSDSDSDSDEGPVRKRRGVLKDKPAATPQPMSERRKTGL